MRRRIYPDITHVIGRTPLVYLSRLARGCAARVAAKLEYLNPGGSSKDRIVLAMIRDAERQGFIGPGSVLVEATSGNTGISLAMVCAVKGYRLILTMPESTPEQQIACFRSHGAEVVATPAAEGMRGAIARAEEIVAGERRAFTPGQFHNPSNPEAHERGTAQEIWDDTAGEVDVVVAGVGTGGTITGVGQGLRRRKPTVKCVAVEPAASPTLSGGYSGMHGIQGIGAGFLPPVLNRELIDDIVTVGDQEAAQTAQTLFRIEGIPAGASSGAAVWAALEVARRRENAGELVVVILPDGSHKHIDTGLVE